MQKSVSVTRLKPCSEHRLCPLEQGWCAQDPKASLAVLGAESQGQVGFLLETALAGALPDLQLATVLTQARQACPTIV